MILDTRARGATVISIIDDRMQMETLELKIDHNHQAVHLRFLHPHRPVFTWQLLEDFSSAQQIIANLCLNPHRNTGAQPLRYMVVSSLLPGVFVLGGDLELFLRLIESEDREGLARYAHTCTELLYRNLSGADGGLCSITLVEGQALGGGFELALASRVLIAEKRARFGFPELQFGLFPGMGAFSLLARRIGPALAKRLITSGRIYTAEELYEMGVVDLVAEDGRAHEMLHHYIQKRRDREAGYAAMETIMARHNPISQEELVEIVDLWVDTAMQLTPRNLTMMRYLLKAQQQRWAGEDAQRGVPRLRA